jgi:hypothetical protein
MTNAAAVATTQDEVVDPEAPLTRKSYDIKTKRVFVQTIDTLVSSGKSHCASCAFVGIPPLYTTIAGRGCSQRLMMWMPRKSLLPTAQKAQLVDFIVGVQVFWTQFSQSLMLSCSRSVSRVFSS